jgi:hypothetical protein
VVAKHCRLFLIISLLCLPALAACSGPAKKKYGPRPAWIEYPAEANKGLAAMGFATNRKLAHSKALAALSGIVAVRLRGVVTNYVKSTERGSTEISKSTIETLTGAGISGARVLGQYYDGGDYFILIGVRDPKLLLTDLGDEMLGGDADKAKAELAIEGELESVHNARKKCGIPIH